MKYFCTKAKCPECRLTFRYAVTEDDIEDGSANDVSCPRCGEQVTISEYESCSEKTYEQLSDNYEELEDQFGLDEFEEDEEDDDDDDWD